MCTMFLQAAIKNLITTTYLRWNLDTTQSHAISDSLILTSTVFSVLDSLTWNASSNRYSFSTVQADKDTVVYYYTQDYDSVFYSTLVDTVFLNDIYSDIVMIDTSEVVNRFYTDFDTIVVSQNSQEFIDPVKIKRSKTFLINDIYVPNNGAMFRESTDCNNNYQQDDELIASDIESICVDSGGAWTDDPKYLVIVFVQIMVLMLRWKICVTICFQLNQGLRGIA